MKNFFTVFLTLLFFFTTSVDAKRKPQVQITELPQIKESQLTGKAKEYYRKAQQGFANEQYELAACFIDGNGLLNFNDGFYWAKKSADQNHHGGVYYLALCYDEGFGVDENKTKAKEYYNKAYNLALPLAQGGDPIAQYVIGMIYDNGRGDVYMNREIAVQWYRKAADQEYANAQYNLGCCYEDGAGVNQDYTQATYWYRKAAEQGCADAQFNLGCSYEKGTGVNQDYTQAAYWYLKAAEQGNANAQCNLGFLYEEGNGVSQDLDQAIYWYGKAVEQDNAVAQFNLGNCYKNGLGVSQDYTKAVYWYRKAAEQGYADAQNNLGVRYWYGEGVPQDKTRAIEWWRKAARQENKNAQNNLRNEGYTW